MSITLKKRQAYSEVYEFINLLDVEYIDKIPKKIYDVFKNERDQSYRKNINPYEDINMQHLKKESRVIISILNLKYWASLEEREILKKLYINNQEKYLEKYSPDNLFENHEPRTKAQEAMTELVIVEKKPNFLVRVINRIKSYFLRSR